MQDSSFKDILGTLFMHLFNIPIRIIKHYILFIRKQTRYPEVDLNEPIKIKNPQSWPPRILLNPKCSEWLQVISKVYCHPHFERYIYFRCGKKTKLTSVNGDLIMFWRSQRFKRLSGPEQTVSRRATSVAFNWKRGSKGRLWHRT